MEDLFCKTIPSQTKNGLKFEISRSKLLDAIDCSKYSDKKLEKCIIILDNLQQTSSNVLESLITVFDETKNKIFLPNDDIVSKGKNHIIAIFDPLSKGNNTKNSLPNSIRNSSFLFKCENFLEDLDEIANKIVGDKDKYLIQFIRDFTTIYNYCKENYKKEIFSLNDFSKYKKISQIIKMSGDNDNQDNNIINYEILIQILLVYRFNNPEDLKTIISKLGYSLNKDLWPIIEYIKYEGTEENPSYYGIQIYPIESDDKNKYFNYRLNTYNESKMNDLKKKMFTMTPEQRFGLIFLIISIQSNIPCIIQGPTASGKDYLIKFFCELLGEIPEIIVLNNDSGINLLTGQIAPQNGIDDEDIKNILDAIKDCEEIDEIYSIFNENDFIKNCKNWKPIDFKNILKKNLDRGERKKLNKIEKLLNDELSFLKHLKNVDSPFINALTSGKWVILDGIESAEPELFERLSSLCDLYDKRLNLFEKGPQYEYSME